MFKFFHLLLIFLKKYVFFISDIISEFPFLLPKGKTKVKFDEDNDLDVERPHRAVLKIGKEICLSFILCSCFYLFFSLCKILIDNRKPQLIVSDTSAPSNNFYCMYSENP